MRTTPDGPGRRRQNEIYRAGVSGERPAVPTGPDELERKAQKAMSAKAWAYVYGGAGAGLTMRANREALDRWQIVPRMLRDTSGVDLSTTVLGTPMSTPLLVAPVGAAGLVTPDADVQIGAGAAAAGTPYILSSQGSSPMEETAKAMGDTPCWYQLYWSNDDELALSFVRRAEAIGAKALVVTLDTPMLAWRPWDLDLGSLPFSQGIGIAQYTSDPRFAELVHERLTAGSSGGGVKITLSAVRTLLNLARHHPGDFRENLRSAVPRASVETFLQVFPNPWLTWDDVARLRGLTDLPVVLKGVLHPDDARRAVDLGVAGVMVSNHGGRQVDGAIGALDALVDVRAAVPDTTVLFDSGVRTGADVFKALALGADAVAIGRPHLYGLALDGADGVAAVMRNLAAELELTMIVSGVDSIGGVTAEMLREV